MKRGHESMLARMQFESTSATVGSKGKLVQIERLTLDLRKDCGWRLVFLI